ncbi:MAG: DNA methyltransferase, partial [Candidatus Hermodarchaeota archaeon]
MSSNYKDKLKKKLSEIFQFEDQDLDFGIHKVMNYRREEIHKFVEEDLIKELNDQIKLITQAEKDIIKEKLEDLSDDANIKKYKEAIQNNDDNIAKNMENLKEIKDYKSFQYNFTSLDNTDELERGIYISLLNFFSRYYHLGDFFPKRKWSSKEKYFIPYNGEETILLWPNKNQYYIKTTEFFKEYIVRIKSLNVKFKVVDVEEEVGNVLTSNKKYFVLSRENPYELDGYNIDVFFEYKTLNVEEKKKYGKKFNQNTINEKTIGLLKKYLNQEKTKELFVEEMGETILYRHLKRYTKRNMMDYFIHKDLRAFLERELDFFIKNEVFSFEDMQRIDHDMLLIQVMRANAIRHISEKIIDFLAQIEEFQLKLWKKKKFVINTDYVITIDKINEYAGEEFLNIIIAIIIENEAQLQEWKDLFDEKISKPNDFILKREITGIKWKPLPLDTKFFDQSFKWDLLQNLTQNNNLDEIIDGCLIKSENFQALNLLMNKWVERIDLIYIDPPFNTGKNDFLYKNDYLDSSWISMMYDRLDLAHDILTRTGSIFVRIDNNGNHYVRFLLDEIFGELNYRNEVIINRTQAKKTIDKPFIQQTESLFF